MENKLNLNANSRLYIGNIYSFNGEPWKNCSMVLFTDEKIMIFNEKGYTVEDNIYERSIRYKRDIAFAAVDLFMALFGSKEESTEYFGAPVYGTLKSLVELLNSHISSTIAGVCNWLEVPYYASFILQRYCAQNKSDLLKDGYFSYMDKVNNYHATVKLSPKGEKSYVVLNVAYCSLQQAMLEVIQVDDHQSDRYLATFGPVGKRTHIFEKLVSLARLDHYLVEVDRLAAYKDSIVTQTMGNTLVWHYERISKDITIKDPYIYKFNGKQIPIQKSLLVPIPDLYYDKIRKTNPETYYSLSDPGKQPTVARQMGKQPEVVSMMTEFMDSFNPDLNPSAYFPSYGDYISGKDTLSWKPKNNKIPGSFNSRAKR